MTDINDLLRAAKWTFANPDMVGFVSTDPSAGAGLILVKSLPAVGQRLLVQLNFSGDTGGVAFSHIVQASDTRETVASSLASQILANATCAAANIRVQYTFGPGAVAIGVTNHLDNLVQISALEHPECFDIHGGQAVLDAGGIWFMHRVPSNFAPPPGSNIAQIVFGAAAASTPGEASVQYATVGVNIKNNDPSDLRGEFALYTAETINGFFGLRKRLGLTRGLYLSGPNSEEAGDMGAGTVNVTAGYYVNGQPQGVWQDYVTTVRPFTGSLNLGNVRARYATIGRTCFVSLSIEILPGGDAGNFLIADLPVDAAAHGYMGGRQRSTGGVLQCVIGDPPNLMTIQTDNNKYPGPGTLIVSGAYECEAN